MCNRQGLVMRAPGLLVYRYRAVVRIKKLKHTACLSLDWASYVWLAGMPYILVCQPDVYQRFVFSIGGSGTGNRSLFHGGSLDLLVFTGIRPSSSSQTPEGTYGQTSLFYLVLQADFTKAPSSLDMPTVVSRCACVALVRQCSLSQPRITGNICASLWP